jgi:hypothetical protein
MTAFNVVRFRVKPGYEQQFIDAHRKARLAVKGFDGGWLVKTGDQTFCIIGQWKSFQRLVDARPEMIQVLDGLRGMLEDLGGGLGVTDPVSGEAVVKLPASKTAAKRPARRKPKKAKRRRK